mmetsp:Transcript_9639/g.17532  ORF Transcript_9639/g.17532 Transcript_9639/m.17532 type:complete len:80 (-) Transcript_9639:1132-1371(-)
MPYGILCSSSTSTITFSLTPGWNKLKLVSMTLPPHASVCFLIRNLEASLYWCKQFQDFFELKNLDGVAKFYQYKNLYLW